MNSRPISSPVSPWTTELPSTYITQDSSIKKRQELAPRDDPRLGNLRKLVDRDYIPTERLLLIQSLPVSPLMSYNRIPIMLIRPLATSPKRESKVPTVQRIQQLELTNVEKAHGEAGEQLIGPMTNPAPDQFPRNLPPQPPYILLKVGGSFVSALSCSHLFSGGCSTIISCPFFFPLYLFVGPLLHASRIASSPKQQSSHHCYELAPSHPTLLLFTTVSLLFVRPRRNRVHPIQLALEIDTVFVDRISQTDTDKKSCIRTRSELILSLDLFSTTIFHRPELDSAKHVNQSHFAPSPLYRITTR
ncbi:hypothetical protein ACRALDRAFT_2021938 [Sodiomyces alcalophilus JCM 7366]|uniref:uncharacterized protein n=1 Tax=Sodiomyces alcalophilus JCM 7366 TaxID=591952 RepID=UPI0039B58A81